MINLGLSLMNELTACRLQIEFFVIETSKIEKDLEMPENEKLSKLKIIRAEISKVGTEIDRIKKSITLVPDNKIN